MLNRFCGYGCCSNSSHNGISRVKLRFGTYSEVEVIIGKCSELIDDYLMIRKPE